jgi:hypothetical protein
MRGSADAGSAYPGSTYPGLRMRDSAHDQARGHEGALPPAYDQTGGRRPPPADRLWRRGGGTLRTTLTLTDRLCALAREASPPPADPGRHSGHSGPDPAAEPVVLADRPDGTVVGVGGIVAKAHPPVPQGDSGRGCGSRGSAGSPDPADAGDPADPADRVDLADLDELAVRLRIAAHPLLTGILLPPLTTVGASAGEHPYMRPPHLYDGRPATLWPRGRPVDPDAPEAAPWEAAGTLLARLHSVSTEALGAQLPRAVPPMRGPRKAARALKRMRAALARRDATGAPPPALKDAASAVEAAWANLPAWCRDEHSADRPSPVSALCHGDFHLGQLVRHPADGGDWQLIDVDDMGLGDPAWDLARPAAWFATGLLPAESWQRFLYAYESTAYGSTAYGSAAHESAAYESAAETSTVGPLGAGPGTWPPRLDAAARALTVQTAALAVAKAHNARRPLDEAETACAEACRRIAVTPAPGQRDETGLSLDPQ